MVQLHSGKNPIGKVGIEKFRLRRAFIDAEGEFAPYDLILMSKSARRTPYKLLWVIGILLTWKVIRTDWVVDFPYQMRRDEGLVAETYSMATSQCPVWNPPQPSMMMDWAKDWESFLPKPLEEVPYTLGKPRLHPDWLTLGVKLFGAFAVLYPLVVWLSLKPSLTPEELLEA